MFVTYIGSVLISVGSTIAVKDSANTSQTGTVSIAAGVGTVNLPTTVKEVVSGVKYTMPQATGSYVNGYTFTVVAGAITAAVAS